jgi:2-iminobutanoate/2-iminopropanoate deaminase
MNNKIHNPPGVPPPFGSYSHGIEIDPRKRVLCISGQLGVREDGSVPAEFAAQAELAFRNMLTVLKSGGMTPEDIVRLGVFLVDGVDLEVYREVRHRMIAASVVEVWAAQAA